ncbi:PTS sugar transporter subunit IIB, partial [Enterococcus cecorum]
FMGDIYRMAAPGGTEVKILSVEDSAKYIESLEETTKLFVLFKNLKSVQKLVDLGIEIDHLQLGGIPYEDGRKKVASAVSLLNEEFAFLEQLSDSHTEVYIQIIPEENKLSMDEIKKNF